MKVLIAPDKFKGTLSARDATEAIARGWQLARPKDTITMLPISDGGDGFGELMSEAIGAKPQSIKTADAVHRPCISNWWWEAKSKTAIIESARVIGLAMLPPGRFHPFDLDTSGLGKLISAANQRGAKRIILGIGGSATNDGGFGLARALDWKFLDAAGRLITDWTELHKLASVCAPRQRNYGNIIVAVDVTNPLLGARGATRIYGPQKGLRPEELARVEKNLRRLAAISKGGKRLASLPGSGAAGGLGFGLATFCDAKLRPGFALFATQANIRRQIRKADLVITGEGAIDRSTIMGKGVGELARLCRTEKIPCIGLGGHIQPTRQHQRLFSRLHALKELTTSEEARTDAAFWLEQLAQRTATRVNA